ncbi:hypothetical protein BCAR13_740025 [Paraburkholderia caribensis]|nr:hypothetical protein BCAR13_740025 [Paraburkholderia caribensis]
MQGGAHVRSVWSGACEVQETYIQYTTWAAHTIRCLPLCYGRSKRVMPLFEALATGNDSCVAVYRTGPLGARG